MSLISMVHNQYFIRFVSVNIELCKHLISLDILGGKAYRICNVTLFVLKCRSEIKQDNLGLLGLDWGAFRGKVACAQDLYVVQVLG